MAERSLDARYRLLAAEFLDEGRGPIWKERLGKDLREALDLLVFVLAQDIGQAPRDLDRQHLKELLVHILPGRLGDTESYRFELADLLEDFLLFCGEREGASSQWEWTSSLAENREAFDRALQDRDRPRLARPRGEPDRRRAEKIGRNDPCPCGSGRKYKQCCLKSL